MAYLQSRSGIARSGVTHCGWTPPSVQVTIGGTDRTALVLRESWSLTMRADGNPSTFAFRVKTITPAEGQDVVVTYATPNDYLFAGTLLQVNASPEAPDSALVIYDCVAVGYQWLLNRYDLVLKRYVNRGVGTIVADILATYTNGGFRVGYCPESLGNLDMEFTFETVFAALQRIAASKNAVVEITPGRIINLFQTYPEAALATVTEASIHQGPSYPFTSRGDLTQVRTRTLFEGQGSEASAAVTAGAATLPLTTLAPFSAAGGFARHRTSFITYTGIDTATSSLTGCSGILDDIAQNEEVNLIVEAEDSGAQTALATLLGGGLSGQATHYLQDRRYSLTEATARADADISTFGGSLQEATFTYKTPQRYVRAGRSVTLAVTSPLSVSGTFTLQSVELTPRDQFSGSNFDVWQTVVAAGFTRSLTDILKQLRG